MMLLKKYAMLVAGIASGSMVGYLYWQFAGCTSGTCPISSNPINSSLYGAVMGGLLISMFINTKN